MIKKIIDLFSNRRVRTDILLAFVPLFLVTIVSIMGYSFYISYILTDRFSDKVISQSSRAATDKTVSYLEEGEILPQIGSRIVAQPEDISLENDQLRAYLMGALDAYPHIASFFVGTEQGKLIQAKRLSNRASFRLYPSKLLPIEAVYAVIFVNLEGENSKEVWHYYDEDGKFVLKEQLPDTVKDHRYQDWYKRTAERGTLQWSNIYILPDSGKLGMTVSFPLRTTYENAGQFMGVIATDITVENISAFLKAENIGEGGIVFIVNDRGEVIAHQEPSQGVEIVNQEPRVIEATDLKQKFLSKAYQLHKHLEQDKFEFDLDGISYIASFQLFPKKFSGEWTIGVVTPKKYFASNAQTMRFRTIIIATIIFIISTFIMVVIARRISRPLEKLVKEANKLTNFDLTGNLSVKSDLQELKDMESALVAMKRSLSAFSKFVPKSLVQKLLKKGGEQKLGGKDAEMTFFFTDVEGFASVSEKLPADKLIVHLSEYFESLTHIIMGQNGTVDKYIGDAIMAFWGAPNPQKDHPFHACRAALLCQKHLAELNRRWQIEEKPMLPTRFGIHTGNAVVGNMGSSERMNYTVIGDSVNLAARLEGVNKFYGTHILVSESVHQKVSKKMVMRPVDIVAVKGREKGLLIYELVGQLKGDQALIPSEKQVEFCEKFTSAFKYYLDRKWDLALEILNDLSPLNEQDKTVSILKERCKKFKKSPPSDTWDGVIKMTEK